MQINAIIINLPEIKVQAEASANLRREALSDSASNGGNQAAPAAPVVLRERPGDLEQTKNTPIDTILFNLKPSFATDENKNIIIRFTDRDGNIVRQYPPEEYLNMMKKLNEIVDSIYSKKV